MSDLPASAVGGRVGWKLGNRIVSGRQRRRRAQGLAEVVVRVESGAMAGLNDRWRVAVATPTFGRLRLDMRLWGTVLPRPMSEQLDLDVHAVRRSRAGAARPRGGFIRPLRFLTLQLTDGTLVEVGLEPEDHAWVADTLITRQVGGGRHGATVR